jgi:hypothetical protein
VNSAVVRSLASGRMLAVPTVGTDVPDREDVLLVPDADLDVCFFIDPAPRPDSLRTFRRDINGSRRIYRSLSVANKRALERMTLLITPLRRVTPNQHFTVFFFLPSVPASRAF